MIINPNRIKCFMGANLMTQEQLAKAAGVSKATVNATLLKGSCSTRTAGKIAKALGVEPAEIVEMEGKA